MAWSKQEIEAIINTASTVEGAVQKTGQHENRYLVYRMLQALYERQTSDEKATQHTNHHNGKGFTPADAKILTSVAQSSKKYKNLTAKQCAHLVCKRLLKYSGQLAKVAKENTPVQQQVVSKPKQMKIRIPLATPHMEPDDFNKKWADYKNQFAQLEKEQEQAAFLSDMPNL